MLYFDRVCRVTIANDNVMANTIEIDSGKIRFEVTKSNIAKDNNGKIEIYNLSSDTRKLISESDGIVTISAGYIKNNGLIEIGQGDITKTLINKDKTEVVTEVYIAEGIKKIKHNPVAISYARNATLGEILSSLSSQTGFSFKQIDTDSAISAQSGYADIGSLDAVLDNLALKYDFAWSVQNGVITIKGNKSVSRSETLVLSPESGLILNPESVKKISRKLKKIKEDESIFTNRITALLQPQLEVHDIIEVQSETLNGRFRINKIIHSGDTRGNEWYSNLEVVPL